MFTVGSFLSINTIFINNTNIIKLIKDGILVKPIQVNQAVLIMETLVQLKVNLTNKARNTTVKIYINLANYAAQA